MSLASAPLLGLSLSLFTVMGGCSNDLGQESVGIQSLKISNFTPTNLGSSSAPVIIKNVVFDLTALGPDNKTVVGDFDVDIYISFSGNKIGNYDACGTNTSASPLAQAHLTAGVATGVKVALTEAYGTATIWAEERVSHALGTSDLMFFPQPTIPVVQTPADLTLTTAAYCSAWNGRHIIVNAATGAGQLIVTSVFGTSFVIADTGAMYDPKTKMGGFNYMDIFTFGAPPIEVKPGLIITEVSGNVAKFNGFTELGFPLQAWKTDINANPVYGTVPATTVLDPLVDEGNLNKLLAIAASTVQAKGAVCAIDVNASQWVKYNTFTLDMSNHACSDAFNTFSVSLPVKVFGSFDPLKVMGTPAQFNVTGMLQNNSGQNEVCKGIGPIIPCKIATDCAKAATTTPMLSTTCIGNLSKASVTCVEGSCRRGPYNFWSIVPRTSDDVVAAP